MAARKSGSDAYNNGEGPFLTLTFCLAILSCEYKVRGLLVSVVLLAYANFLFSYRTHQLP